MSAGRMAPADVRVYTRWLNARMASVVPTPHSKAVTKCW